MCSLFRFTADVRSVLSRNLHQHRLWWSSDRGLSSSPFFFCFVLSNCFPVWHPPDHSPSTLDPSPSKNGLTWGLSGGESILNSKGMEKANLRMFQEAFLPTFFFFFFFFFRMESLPYSSTYADCVRVMFVLCVCMRTSAVFLFNYLKIWSGWTLKQDKNKPFHDLRLQFQFGTSYLTSKGGANGDLLNRLAKKKKPQRLCTSNSSLEKLLMSQTSRGLLL